MSDHKALGIAYASKRNRVNNQTMPHSGTPTTGNQQADSEKYSCEHGMAFGGECKQCDAHSDARNHAETQIDLQDGRHDEEALYHGGLVEDSNTPHDELKQIDDLSVRDEGNMDKDEESFAKGGMVGRIMMKRRPEHVPDAYEKGLLADEPKEEDNAQAMLDELEKSAPDEQDKKNTSLASRAMARRRATK
jgi:hypothetical protein